MSLVRGIRCLALGLTLGLPLGAVACSGGTGLPDAPMPDAPPPMSQVSVAWTLVDGAATVTCEQANALVVSVEITSPSIGGGFIEAFTCANGSGTSKSLPPGTYDLAFELIGRGGSLGVLPSQRVQLRAGQITEATPLQFPVTVTPTAQP